MSQNERFEIVKLKQLDCEKCKAINKLMKTERDCPKDCSNKSGKTREEYEDMIAEKVFNALKNIENNTKARQHLKIVISWQELKINRYLEYSYFRHSVLEIAKTVCDTLFGKSK